MSQAPRAFPPRLPVSAATLLRGAERLLFTGIRLAPFDLQRVLLGNLLRDAFPDALRDGVFEPLRGRWLRIEVLDGPGWNVSMGGSELIVALGDIPPDVRIAASFEDYVLLASQQADPDTLFFQRRLLIEGDTELGLVVKNLIFGSELAGMPATLLRILVALREHAMRYGIDRAPMPASPNQ